jgi:hypothetical protein
MTKVRAPGSCAEAQWDAVRAIGRQKLGGDCSDEAARAEGIAEMARLFGISKGVMRNMLDPDQPERLSLERAALLSRQFSIDVLAQWLATESGGMFVPLPDPSSDLERLTAAGVRKVGETAAEIIESLGEQSAMGRMLSVEEARAVRRDARTIAATFGEIAAIADRVIDRARRNAQKARGS